MKKIYRRIILIVLFFSCYLGNAQFKQEQLVGTWIFDYSVSISKMGEKARSHYEKMQKESKNRFEKSFKDRKMSFISDNSFLQQTLDGILVSGTWMLSDNRENIILTNKQGNKLELKIKEISTSSLVLQPVNTAKGQVMLLDWYFNKN